MSSSIIGSILGRLDGIHPFKQAIIDPFKYPPQLMDQTVEVTTTSARKAKIAGLIHEMAPVVL